MPAPPITARALSPVAARPLSFSGVRVRVQDNNYRPLHWASYKDDNSECAQLLVDAGADLGVTSANGFTPLQMANGHNNVVSSKPGVAAVLEEAMDHPRQPWRSPGVQRSEGRASAEAIAHTDEMPPLPAALVGDGPARSRAPTLRSSAWSPLEEARAAAAAARARSADASPLVGASDPWSSSLASPWSSASAMATSAPVPTPHRAAIREGDTPATTASPSTEAHGSRMHARGARLTMSADALPRAQRVAVPVQEAPGPLPEPSESADRTAVARSASLSRTSASFSSASAGSPASSPFAAAGRVARASAVGAVVTATFVSHAMAHVGPRPWLTQTLIATICLFLPFFVLLLPSASRYTAGRTAFELVEALLLPPDVARQHASMSRAAEEESRRASIPPQYVCPITGELMREPVTTADGHSFERRAIEKWLLTHSTSPMTGALLPHKQLSPAIALRQLIDAHRGTRSD